MDARQIFARLAKADFADAIGVAVGADSVAVAQVRKRFNTVTVVDFESRAIAGGDERRWEDIAGFTRDFALTRVPDGARIAVALERRETLLSQLTLPAAAGDNLEKVVAYEVDRLFPVAADSVYTAQFSRALGAARDRLAVHVVAAARASVEAAARAFGEAGLAPSAVTAVPVAINDYYAFCRGDVPGTGAIFHRDGGRDYLTLSHDGLLVSSVRYNAAADGDREERVEKEIEVSLIDGRDERPELIIDEANVEEGQLGLAAIAPTELLPAGARPTWLEATAIGAALGQLNEARVKMNLLPQSLAKAEEGIGLREMGLAAAVVVLSATLAASIALKDLGIRSALASEVGRLLPEVTAVTKLEEENRALLTKITMLEHARAVSVLAYMRDMTARIPDTAYLTTFRYKGDRIELDGIADNAAGMISVLEQSSYFKNVEFTAPTTKYLQDQERFSLKMELEQ
jgi:Tfp pilus assembly protein PilN